MKKFNSIFLILITSVLLLSGCTNNKNLTSETSDPFEKFNRKIFAFNKNIDEYVVKPISKKYVSTLPATAGADIGIGAMYLMDTTGGSRLFIQTTT